VTEDSNRPAQSLAPPAAMAIVETTMLAALKASEPAAASPSGGLRAAGRR
jgi:hypothetical protein